MAGGRRTESTGATAGLWSVADGRSPREPLQGYGWWPRGLAVLGMQVAAVQAAGDDGVEGGTPQLGTEQGRVD
eukprot:gene17226-biopygen17319